MYYAVSTPRVSAALAAALLVSLTGAAEPSQAWFDAADDSLVPMGHFDILQMWAGAIDGDLYLRLELAAVMPTDGSAAYVLAWTNEATRIQLVCWVDGDEFGAPQPACLAEQIGNVDGAGAIRGVASPAPAVAFHAALDDGGATLYARVPGAAPGGLPTEVAGASYACNPRGSWAYLHAMRLCVLADSTADVPVPGSTAPPVLLYLPGSPPDPEQPPSIDRPPMDIPDPAEGGLPELPPVEGVGPPEDLPDPSAGEVPEIP